MRWRTSIAAILTATVCALIALLLSSWRYGDFDLWRMRAHLRRLDTAHPMSHLESKADDYVALALGEGPNTWRTYEKKLLAVGRLSQRNFVLSKPSYPEAYKRLWKELAATAPGAHFSLQGKEGPSFYVFTNVHAVAPVEDMRKLEKVVALFNSSEQQGGSQPDASGDSATQLLFRAAPER